MAKKGKIADPHAEREAARYDNPIPSREFILQLLTDVEHPLDRNAISQRLKLTEPDALDALRKRLRAMERDGQLMVNRRGAYGLVDKMHLLHCRVQGHRDGYGFAMPLAEGDDVYLNARQMNFVFDGDEVLACQDVVRRVPVAENVTSYAVRLVRATRVGSEEQSRAAAEFLAWGAGPRAAQYLVRGAKTRALLDGRPTPDLEDVRRLALPVLRHRLVSNFHAEAENVGKDRIIELILDEVAP